MFNALNRFIARLDGDAQGANQSSLSNADHDAAHGFHVLRNTTMSLAVEPFFDFIIGINGRLIDNPDPDLFALEVRNCAGGMLSLSLWSAKGQRHREIHVSVPTSPPSLGLTLQWTPLSVAANIWHVLDVPTNSPADLAGLLPYGDYILGSPEGVLHGEGGLGELVEDHIGRPMRLYVYNNEFDVTREVTVQPSRDWGGQGALGCVLGYGALHRLPAPLSEPVDAPGETMFDGGLGLGPTTSSLQRPNWDGIESGEPSAHMLVPADLTAPSESTTPPPPGGPPRSAAKKRKERHQKPSNLMDDYLREEEQKSRELDRAPSGRMIPAPPPPKAGGPVELQAPPAASRPAPQSDPSHTPTQKSLSPPPLPPPPASSSPVPQVEESSEEPKEQ